MTVSEKLKTVDNKKEQNKTAKISDLSSGNVSKYKFSSGEDVLAEIKAVKKSCYNQNISMFNIKLWIEKESRNYKIASGIRHVFWIW